MSEEIQCEVLIVGGGPGGYVAAIRAGQLGLRTVLVEAGRLGGTCLIRGCVPSKALIDGAARYDTILSHATNSEHLGISIAGPPDLNFPAMVQWKDGIVDRLNGSVSQLLKKAGVTCLRGWAVFSEAKTCDVVTEEGLIQVHADNVILATGSDPAELPPLPFGGKVMNSTDILNLNEVPGNLCIIGAGVIGLEMACVFAKLGSQVTVLEQADQILPAFDPEIVNPLARALSRRGVDVETSVSVVGGDNLDGEPEITSRRTDGEEFSTSSDLVLVAIGRRPVTAGMGLDSLALGMSGDFVAVDDQCRTTAPGIWAIGDVIGEPMLAHKASHQGEMVAEIIAGRRRRFDPRAIPSVCYADPEVVAVGMSPDAAEAAGEAVVSGKFPLAANARAISMAGGMVEGFIRVTARKDDHVILGIHAVGPHVSELCGEFVHALEMGARLEDVAATMHAHPTMTEAVGEAALAALGHPLHA